MRQERVFSTLLVSVSLITFGGLGYLLALEGVAFFLALKNFFKIVLGFGILLFLFFTVTAALLYLVDIIGGLFRKKPTSSRA